MLAGRPHEAVGNGSPRWMTAAPRSGGTEPGLQADSPTFIALNWAFAVTAPPGSVPVPLELGQGWHLRPRVPVRRRPSPPPTADRSGRGLAGHKLGTNLAASGITAQHVGRISDSLVLHLGRVPHSEMVKIVPDVPATATADKMKTRSAATGPSRSRPRPASPVTQVREMYGKIPPQ